MITASMAPVAEAPKPVVLYDGQCPLCQKSVRILKRLDWFRSIRYQDARDVANLPAARVPLIPHRLLEEMHLLTPDGGSAYAGFYAFRYIAWYLPLLWLLVPLMYLPGVPKVGQRVYLWVAKNRFDLVPCHDGQCAVPLRKRDG